MLTMRRARPDDAGTLERWDAEPHVIAASGDDDKEDWDTELPRDADWREWWIAEVGGRAIGIVQILDPAREPEGYWGDDLPAGLRAIDIWIGEADCLGKGYGTQMMEYAFARCFAATDVTAILIDPLESNTRARRFYERLGFREVGPRRFGVDDCVVYRLARADWQGRQHPDS